jgi:hypothetical protein
MTEETQATEQAPSLELRDIAAMLQIINITTQRGAIRAEEMAEVGAVYNKVNAFLQASLPKEDAEAVAAQQEAAAAAAKAEAEAE